MDLRAIGCDGVDCLVYYLISFIIILVWKVLKLLPQNYQKRYVGHIPFAVQYNKGFNFHSVSFVILTDVVLKRNVLLS